MGKGAKVTMSAHGKRIGEATMKATVPARFGIDTFGIGQDSGQPVTAAYQAPYKFTGEIEKVVVEMK